ncbi:MAG TPA: cobalamin biosynthesis protein CobW [Aliidongia sp.]|nr:cobalamin biosynthesis protein CobW [Aliidongia sp.]
MPKIPATIITGFLGAGKTSLIRHLIQEAGGRRIALLINEFGELGIDREVLLGCGVEGCREEDVVELANGCICCTVADDFLPTLGRLIDRPDPPDHIVIETSGLALPKPLVQAFNWPEIRSRVTVDGVVTVIDAVAVAAGRFADDPEAVAAQRAADPSLDHDNPLEEVFGDQLACADLIVLNKRDLLDPAAYGAVERTLRAGLRPAVQILAAAHGKVPPDILLGLAAAAEDDLAQRPSCHDGEDGHDHDDFDSFQLARGPVEDPAGFAMRIEAAMAKHDILRIKGFLDVGGKPFRSVVQGVGGRVQHYFDRPWRADEDRSSRLVVIGRKGIDRAAIELDLAG